MRNGVVFYKRDSFLYLCATLISLALSWFIDFNETVINPDAICYLMSAEKVGSSGISAAMRLCPQSNWPLYPALIYYFDQITYFSYATTAYLLDAIFSAISVCLFIRITKELGASRRIMWLAAAVILLSHEFNSVREYIIRDHGFWTFYLGSLLLLLRYVHKPRFILAVAWSASITLATMFRIEGAIFLLAMPFITWLCLSYPFAQRAKMFFSLNALTIGGLLMIVAWLALHPQESLAKLGRVAEVKDQLQHGLVMIGERYQATETSLAQHVLDHSSSRDAGILLFLVLVVWYVLSVIGNLSWIYGVLVIYGWWRKAGELTTEAALVLGGYLAVNVIVTLGFLFEHLFLSKRYLIALSLIFMLRVPFVLDYLIKNSHKMRYRVFLILAVIFIFISSLGGIFNFGYSKQYIHDAGDWIAENVPSNASLYANDYQLMYYSKHFGDEIFKTLQRYIQVEAMQKDGWKQYDYIALRIGKSMTPDMEEVMQEEGLKPLKVFRNQRGDKVIIYKLSKASNISHEGKIN